MAVLMAARGADDLDTAGRVSPLIPAVKCASCAEAISLESLGHHICRPASQPPVSPRSPAPSVRSTASSARLRAPETSAHRAATPQLHSPLDPRMRSPSPLSVASNPYFDSQRLPPINMQRLPPGIQMQHSQHSPRSPHPPLSPVVVPEVATHTGGEAGMAGVGRRGFAAAARAAMFAAPMSPYLPPEPQYRRQGPQYLDISNAAGLGGDGGEFRAILHVQREEVRVEPDSFSSNASSVIPEVTLLAFLFTQSSVVNSPWSRPRTLVPHDFAVVQFTPSVDSSTHCTSC